MKDKTIFKKWWFWVIVVIVLVAIGAAAQPSDDNTNTADTTKPQQATEKAGILPAVNASEYNGKEGLVAYKELKAKGYTVDADFENQALTDINGKASAVFEPLDVNKADERQSVDAFVVSNLAQNGDSVKLTIVKSSN